MYSRDDTPDRRFWTSYDRFKFEQEARALRRAELYAMAKTLLQRFRASKGWQRLRTALDNAGAQPRKSSRVA